MQNFEGVSGGELVMPAHERPYHITLTLTARDSDGLTASTSIEIDPNPNAAPVPVILEPSADAGFSAGEQIDFSGLAVDAEDGFLPQSGLSWRIVGVDCPDTDCVDQALASESDHGDFTAPSGPIPYALRLKLTATDQEGASTTTAVRLEPRVAALKIDSRRVGARVSIAGQRGQIPFTMDVLRGADVRIATPASQHAPDKGRKAELRWRRWSDGGERVHFVTLDGDRTYRPTFKMHKGR